MYSVYISLNEKKEIISIASDYEIENKLIAYKDSDEIDGFFSNNKLLIDVGDSEEYKYATTKYLTTKFDKPIFDAYFAPNFCYEDGSIKLIEKNNDYSDYDEPIETRVSTLEQALNMVLTGVTE